MQYEYSMEESTGYTDQVPAEAGPYYVRALVAETKNYREAVSKPLGFAIARASIAALCDKLEEIAANGKPASERLSEMALFIIRTFREKRKYHRAIMENVPPPKDSSHPVIVGDMRRQTIIEGVIRDGVKAGEFRSVNLAAAVILFNGAIHNICMLSDFRDEDIDPVPVVQLFLRSIQTNHE